MAALVVQSRFAGLKIEDDDYPASEVQKVKKTKPIVVKKPEPPKKTKNTNTKSQVPKYIKVPTLRKKRKASRYLPRYLRALRFFC